MPRRFSAVFAVLAVVAGCSGPNDQAVTSSTRGSATSVSGPEATAPPGSIGVTDSTSASTGPATTAPGSDSSVVSVDAGLTGVTAELADLRAANGFRLPADAALDHFASVFGPVAGADPDRFESRPADGSLALMEVLGNWDTYTAEQQDEVRARFGYPKRNSLRSTPRQAADPRLQAQIDEARVAFAARLGVDPPFPMEGEVWSEILVEGEDRPVLGVSVAERAGDFATSGSLDRCRILFPRDPAPSATTVAHEVFHCFQYHLAGDVAEVLTGERWIIEGSAEWAGAEVMGVDADVVAHFKDWVDNTGTMFALDYGAVGFYWVVESMGVDPWPVVGAMLGHGTTDAIAAMGLDPATVLNRVATSIARRSASPTLSAISEVWDFDDAEVPPGGVRSEATVTIDEPFEEELLRGGYARGSVPLVKLEGGDRVQVLVDADVGTIQFFEREEIPFAEGLFREFCLDPGGCRCGVGDSVDSGLGEGSRELIIGAGELAGGPIASTVRIPDPEGAFTDGRWVGRLSSSSLMMMSDGTTGRRTSFDTPFEITVEDGAITAGVFDLSFLAQATTAGGRGQGTATITGVYTGCGFSPQMQGTAFSIEGTMNIGGSEIPLDVSFAMTPVAGSAGTFWVPDRVTNPRTRSGSIDASGFLAAIRAGGFAVSGMEISFLATQVG